MCLHHVNICVDSSVYACLSWIFLSVVMCVCVWVNVFALFLCTGGCELMLVLMYVCAEHMCVCIMCVSVYFIFGLCILKLALTTMCTDLRRSDRK